MLLPLALHIAHAADLVTTPGIVSGISGDRLTQVQVQSNGLTSILNAIWNRGLTFFFAFVGICAVWQIIGAANGYAMSKGDPTKTEAIRRGLVQTVMGITIIVASMIIVGFILGTIRYLGGYGS